MELQKDVVIVGAGMVGLSLALALHRKGLQVAIVESRKINNNINTSAVETRFSAINHTSKRLFKDLGVWDCIKSSRISPYYSMKVWDDNLENEISFTAEDLAEHSLGCIIENDVIINALLEKISDTSIEIIDGVKISEIHRQQGIAKVFLNGKTIETNLVVGADGANSFIGDYFNFEKSIKPYTHTAIVATVQLQKSHNQTAFQRFYDKGVLALLPVEDSHKSSIVWSVTPDYGRYLMNLDVLDFESRLKSDIDDVLGDVKLLSKKFSFELVQRHAKQYAQDNVVLVGDACHSIHPLAGQGVNLGFKDVISLADVLGKAFSKGRLIGHISTLDKYQRDRKLDNTKMIITMKTFKELFGSEKNIVQTIRRFGLGIVNDNNIAKKIFVKQAL